MYIFDKTQRKCIVFLLPRCNRIYSLQQMFRKPNKKQIKRLNASKNLTYKSDSATHAIITRHESPD